MPLTPSEFHGLLLATAWGYLIDIAIIVSRHFKGRSLRYNYYMIHGIILCISFMLSVYAIYHMVSLKGLHLIGKSSLRTVHNCLGFFFLVASGYGCYLGYRSRNSLMSGTNPILVNEDKREMIKFGWVCYGIGKFELLLAAIFYKEGAFLPLYFVSALGLAGLHYFFEMRSKRLRFRYKELPDIVPLSQNNRIDRLLHEINEGRPISDLRSDYPEIKWVIYGKRIYDLTNFSHPGGDFIIQHVVGHEVSRYMYGGSSVELFGVSAYNHSASAYEILEQFRIGTLDKLENIFINTGEGGEMAIRKDESEISASLHMASGDRDESSRLNEWHLVRRTPEKTKPDVSRFELSTKDLIIRRNISSPTGFGRSVLLSFSYDVSLSRTYTICLCLAEENQILRDALIKFFDNTIEENKPQPFKFEEKNIAYMETLPLFIKKYPSRKGLSAALHTHLDDENTFKLIGPLGRGLELSPKEQGAICILFAGTGILPFLDFFNFLLCKRIHYVLHAKFGVEGVKDLGALGMHFEEAFENLDITVVGSFGQGTLGLDIIEKLAQMSHNFKLNKFRAMIKSVQSEYIENVKIDNNTILELAKESFNKFYICGPENFNLEMVQKLRKNHVPQKKLILV